MNDINIAEIITKIRRSGPKPSAAIHSVTKMNQSGNILKLYLQNKGAL